MASIIQLFVSVTFVLTLVYANSSPPTNTSVTEVSPIVPIEINKHSECHSNAECGGHGICTNLTKCDCDLGWTTHGSSVDKNKPCSYEERSKKTTFFLSFFLGSFGADWFHLSCQNLGYITAGISKLLLGFGCCGAWLLSYYGPEIQNLERVKTKLRGVSTFLSLVAFTWWIVDWARVLSNKFPDGNGVQLTRW